jgi:hypothetical protein
VDQGLAAGRIIQADHDKRVEQIANAQSVDELRMLTHDLDRDVMFGGAIPSPSPVAAPPPPPPPPPAAPAPMPVAPMAPQPVSPVAPTPNVPYGPPVTISQESISEVEAAVGNAAKKSGRSCLGCLIPLVVVLAVFGGTGLAVYSDVRDAIHDAFDSASDNGGLPGSSPEKQEADVLSVGGWNDLVAALREKTGSTEVFTLVAYPTYAVVTAPVDTTSGRSQALYWDGEFGSAPGNGGTSMTDRFDLADIRPGVVIRLVTKARKLVENPTTWYAIVQAPDLEGASITAYASNEFQETAYIAATADGKVVRRLLP